MALAPGVRLGPYKIAAQIGVGGVGEVYRATDTKLDRDVAIKILHETFAHRADRLARFGREAKTLVSLEPRTSPRWTAFVEHLESDAPHVTREETSLSRGTVSSRGCPC
jgi:serine/threonine protein kinase